MYRLIKLLCFVTVLALEYAYLEIQIEGKEGWGKNLPCWKREYKYILKIIGGKPLTGYHVAMVFFILTFFHFSFLFVPWNASLELLVLGLFFYFLFAEDLLWFVISSHYGLKELFTKQVEWHNYWGFLPDCYYYYPALAAILIYFGRDSISLII